MKKKNEKNSHLRKVYLLSAIFFIISFISCKKDGQLIPAFDNGNIAVLFTDTLSLKTSVVLEDSIRTDIAAFNLLGIFNDPVFGPTSSSIYSQVTLNGLNVDFGTSPTLDSIVLTLKYADLYGDSSSFMNINVYQITTPLVKPTDNSTGYYSNRYLSYNPTPIASKTFLPNLTDSVFLLFDSTMVAPHLRINLGNTFGQMIMNESGGANLADNNAFTQFMNGLYLTTQDSVQNTTLAPGTGSIAYFDINSSVSTVTIYYNDTSSYNFIMNSESVKYNRFDHNYSGTDIEAKVLGGGDTSLSYVQTMAGVKTKINIPYIKDLAKNGNIIINKAELVITLENGSDINLEAVPTIALVGIDANGNPVFLPDAEGGTKDMGGVLDATSKKYTFDIAQHLHDLTYSSNQDYGMYLIPSGASISAYRSVIDSEKNQVTKMKLNVTYSKL